MTHHLLGWQESEKKESKHQYFTHDIWWRSRLPTPYSTGKTPTASHSVVILPLTSTKPGYYLKCFIDPLLALPHHVFTHCSDTFLHHQADLMVRQHALFPLTRAEDVLCSSLCTWALSFCVTFIWSCKNRWIASVWLVGRSDTQRPLTQGNERDIFEGFFVFNLRIDWYSPCLVQGEALCLLKLEIRDCDSHVCLVCLLSHCTLNQAPLLCEYEAERKG